MMTSLNLGENLRDELFGERLTIRTNVAWGGDLLRKASFHKFIWTRRVILEEVMWLQATDKQFAKLG